VYVFLRYDAKYYGYAWADAIACDLATPFRESPDGFLDAKVGRRFRREILQPGNSRDINESIEKFLGRKWSTDAMFEEMLETTSSSNQSRGRFYLYCVVFGIVCVSLSVLSVLVLHQKKQKEPKNKDPSEEALAVPLVSYYGSTT
jgi:hypothetical protein